MLQHTQGYFLSTWPPSISKHDSQRVTVALNNFCNVATMIMAHASLIRCFKTAKLRNFRSVDFVYDETLRKKIHWGKIR